MLQTVTKYVLFAANFATGERNSENRGYFSSESEAKKIADLPEGWYGSKGSVYKSEFDANKLPKYYNTAMEWANDNLTPNKIKQYELC